MHELQTATIHTHYNTQASFCRRRQLVANVRKLNAACHSSGSVPRHAGPTDSALEVLLSAGKGRWYGLNCLVIAETWWSLIPTHAPHPTPSHHSVKWKLVSDRQRPQYTTCFYRNVASSDAGSGTVQTFRKQYVPSKRRQLHDQRHIFSNTEWAH